MNNFFKNICLITFALVAPITLPAGGIQKSINEISYLNNSKEIILSTNCSLYCFPSNDAKKLMTINFGNPLLILRKWEINKKELWLRVELATNQLFDDPNKITKGWIKM
tara:strand:- start:4 stop:330 length:327 start_codon:yes stop_codon:yes gene_type:complete